MPAEKDSDDDFHLFRKAMQDIKPLKHDKVLLKARNRVQYQRQFQQPYHEQILSDCETEAKVCSERVLSFIRPGIQRKVAQKMRQGRFVIEAEIDLHGMTVAKAQHELEKFLRLCKKRSAKHVLIIHGKGNSTPNNPPILKNRVNNWLRHYPNVLAFCSAQQSDGGTGAVYVLLKV